jgi:hypothetical protein
MLALIVTNDVEDRRVGWSKSDKENTVPDCRGMLLARLLQVPRIINIHNNATKITSIHNNATGCLIPLDDITVWDTGASIPFNSVHFLFYKQILPHRLVYIVWLEQIAVFFPLIYTQPFVIACGAAAKKLRPIPF